MEFSIMLGFFLMGTFFGSFYHVVGYRMTKGESIIYPASHCPNCNHVLKPYELIPVFSFLLQRGKCTKCKSKISWWYPVAEVLCGLLFLLTYLSFGLTWQLLTALTFVSMLIIIFFSDIYYMIIEDKVLVFFGIILMIEMYFINGLDSLLNSLLSGLIAFIIMLLLKLFGDFIFKKEAMGGGDVKLMFIIGMIIGYKIIPISIFLASLIALPVSIIILALKKDHAIPFGPFLSLSAIIIMLTKIDINWVIDLIR